MWYRGSSGGCASQERSVKIIAKLTLALVGGTCVVLAVNGYLRVERERAFYEADRVRDHELIGRSLGAAAAAVWKSDGPMAAVAAIEAVNRHFTNIQIGWVPSEVSAGLPVEPATLGNTPTEQPLTRIFSGKAARWRTFVPLDVDGVRRGVIELSEPATSERQFVLGSIGDTLGTAILLAVVSALLSFGMSQWLVGRPVRALCEKARRVGRGDFASQVALGQSDELAELATEMNAMSDRLVATMEQLRHADRLAIVGTLASGVAHELGTPLNVVGARAGMIAAGEATPEESKDYARVIVASADRMAATIRRLLQFARRGEARKTRRDLLELVNESVELLRPLARKRSIELVTHPTAADPMASVDGGQIQQVITNLVMNALQAMPEGGTIEIGIQRRPAVPPVDVGGDEAEHLCVRVKDQGQGIAPENLPHIFEPFFTTKDVGEGTGLGLAVTYGIIREHGGWITVDSAPAQGSTFSVYLPVEGAA
jgi:two-component system NtrC family sensor kinase